MLESLTIRNYAIIDELTVDFAPGLNVITGETGAGKSIVIDAFELILGARSSSDMVRTGTDALTVSGVFRVDGVALPDDMQVSPEDGCFIVRREVRADGASRCWVNDVPVTVKVLKMIGDRLVDLHGQHDHQSLFDVPKHVTFLDDYGGFVPLARSVAAGYRELAQLAETIRTHEESIARHAREGDLSRFQFEEIESANLKPDEDGQLATDLSRLSRATELKALGWEVFQNLSESEDSAGERIGRLATQASHLARFDSGLAPLNARLDELSITIRDIAETFREYADAIDDDPGAIAEMETRLTLIERLKKKYGPTLADVFAFRDNLHRQSQDTEDLERELENLLHRRAKLTETLALAARDLSEKRKQAAPSLSSEVESHLAQLGMPGARLVIAIELVSSGERLETPSGELIVGADGMDRVEFTFSANPGEPPKPLVKVASGGEISRVMLSLKLALIEAAGVPTMVFDEIDNGVSGRVADSIGKKMLALASHRQVLTITHLPQIAVMADRHYSARKRVNEGRTVTDLISLGNDARRTELAMLLSGEKLTDTALAHAGELMEQVAAMRADVAKSKPKTAKQRSGS